MEDHGTTSDSHGDGGHNGDHTFVEMDPLQGALASDSGAGKPKFWAESQDGLVKGAGDSNTGEYGFVRTVSL